MKCWTASDEAVKAMPKAMVPIILFLFDCGFVVSI